MSETALTASAANALSGATDSETDFTYPTIGESPYYTTMYRALAKLVRLAKVPGNSLRVYKDGDLTFGVRAGRFMDGATARDYAGATGESLTDDATNYVFLTPAAALTVNTTGFPSTPHVPLGAIETASGSYDHDDITDYRGRAVFQFAGGLTLAAGAETADQRTITIQGGPWPQRLRVWIATSDYGAPNASGNTVAVSTGTTLREITANADYEIITGASGTAAIDVTVSGAASRYIMVETDGRIFSSGEITWAA